MEGEVIPAGQRQKQPKRTYSPSGARNVHNLTAEQEAYCRARAMGMSIKEAHSTSGLSITFHSAQRWERDIPEIRKRIEELSRLATDNAILRTGLSRGWVIDRLMTVVDRCMQEEPVRDKEGNPTGEFSFNAAGANQALKMLGDTMGLFNHSNRTEDDEYANLTDDDIARIAADLARQTGLVMIEDSQEGQ